MFELLSLFEFHFVYFFSFFDLLIFVHLQKKIAGSEEYYLVGKCQTSGSTSSVSSSARQLTGVATIEALKAPSSSC